MRFSSQDETCDSNTPWSSSSRTSVYGGIRRSIETIESISNSSVHTYSTADTHKDFSDPPAVSHPTSESPTDQYFSNFDSKSFHSLGKPTSLSRNQSLSTIRTTREPESDGEDDSGGSTLPSTPKRESSSSSLSTLEDEAEISSPHTPRSPQTTVPTRAKAPSLSPSSSSSPVFAAPYPPLNAPLKKSSYGDSQLYATTEIPTPYTPVIGPPPFFPPPTERIGTRSRARSSSNAITFKEKKGIIGFMNGLRKSVDFRIFPGKLQEILQDNRVPKHDQEKDLPAIEFFNGRDWETMRNHALQVPRPPLPRFPGMAPAADPEVSKPADDSLTTGLRVPRFQRPISYNLKQLTLPLPKSGHSRAHSSGNLQVLSTNHSPFPPLPPMRPNLDLSNFQQALPKPPRIDTLVRGYATGDRRSPELPASAKATPTTSPVTERRAQPTTTLQRRSAVTASLAKSTRAIPRRRVKKKKTNEASDADLMKRLQGICKDADPSRSYQNLVKIGQG
jgi:hypothetical protein